MRQIILILGLLFAASLAQAAPNIRAGAPYPQARAALIRQGYLPQHVTQKSDEEICSRDGFLCRTYPELMGCSGSGIHVCNMLFRDRHGVFWLIGGKGEANAETELSRFRFDGAEAAQQPWLDDIKVDGLSVSAKGAPKASRRAPQPRRSPP